MTDFFVTYFVAFKFPIASETVYNKIVKVKLQPNDKEQQIKDVVKAIAEKSILVDYHHPDSIVSFDQFYRRHTTIISLTQL